MLGGYEPDGEEEDSTSLDAILWNELAPHKHPHGLAHFTANLIINLSVYSVMS